LFRNAVQVLASSLMSIPFQVLASVILARWLSVEDRGLYSVAVTFAVTLAGLVELGWGPAVIYRTRRAGSPPARVATAALTAVVGLSLLAALACLPVQGWIRARFLDGASLGILLCALAIVPFQLAWIFFACLARALDRFAIENVSHVLIFMGRALAIAAALILFGGALQEALAAYVSVMVVVTVGVVAMVVRTTGLELPPRWGEIRETLRFGSKAYVTRLSTRLHDSFDVFMLAYFLGDPEQVAIYTVALTLTVQLKMLPEAIARALFPQLAGLPEEVAGKLTALSLRHTLFWVGLAMLFIVPVTPFAIPLLFGEPYRASILPFFVLLPGMAFLTMFRISSGYFSAVGHQAANVRTQLFAAGVNVAANLILIPKFGLLGAALANVTSNATGAILITLAFIQGSGLGMRQILRVSPRDLDPYRRRIEFLRRRWRPTR
jgi:O-antigen/teichoic acid export membrane protein